MPTNAEELVERLERIESRLISSAEMEKRLADLELKVESGKFKDISSELQALRGMIIQNCSDCDYLKREIEKLRSSLKPTQQVDLTDRFYKIDAEIVSLRHLFNKINESLPKGFFDKDINLIKGKVQRLGSLEDEVMNLRKEIEMIKSSQMRTIPPQLFEEMANKIKKLEKRVKEELKSQPVVLE